jgi:hypothetical protein
MSISCLKGFDVLIEPPEKLRNVELLYIQPRMFVEKLKESLAKP